MDKLHILWTTDNKDTVLNMLAMYAINAKANGWWNEVNIIIWGASAKLVSKDKLVQQEIKEMIEHGIHVEACKACSDNLCVTDILLELGIDVKYMGSILTEYIKADEKILML